MRTSRSTREAVLDRARSYCVVSPHSDDAALSIAGTMKWLAATGKPLTLVTCFSRSCFCGNGEIRGVDAVSSLRKQEDVAFLNLVSANAEAVWIDLPDAPLRGMADDSLFLSRSLSDEEMALAREVTGRLRRVLEPASVVFLPFGIGSHVDHLIAREAVLSLAGDGVATLALYEDLPYASIYPRQALDAVVSRLARSRRLLLRPFEVSFAGMMAFKRAALECYASQVSAEWIEVTLSHAASFESPHAGAERVWGVESLASDLDDAGRASGPS